MEYQSNSFGPTVDGIKQKLKMIEIVTRNIANVGTAGYKREIPESATFKSVMDEVTVKEQDQGPINKTGNMFDLAIEGNASFLVEGKNGPEPSRLGKFDVNSNGKIVNHLGQELIIVERTDKEIDLSKSRDIHITKEGEIQVGKEKYGRIALQILDSKPVKIHQGAIEGSNVNLMTEMASLSMIFRSFETSQQVLGMEASVDKDLIEKYGRNV